MFILFFSPTIFLMHKPIVENSTSLEEQDSQNLGHEEVVSEPSSSTSRNEQDFIKKYFRRQTITVSMTSESFRKHLIELVIKNGVALSFFSSPAFLGLTGEMASKLEISLERHAIRSMILQEANKQKTSLKSVLNDKFYFLKVDACTRQRTNYIGINIQFVDDDDNLAIRTLAVRDTEAQHSSDC